MPKIERRSTWSAHTWQAADPLGRPVLARATKGNASMFTQSHTWPKSPRGTAHHTPRRFAVVLSFILCLAVTAPVAAVPSASGKNAAVITTWNQVAASIVTPNPAAFLNYAFVHLAMYNAVNGITGEYELYQWNEHADMSASPEAAAAAAAHRVLSTYFPASVAALDDQLTASLAVIPSGTRRDNGVAFGQMAADHIIALRTNDGRGAMVSIPPAVQGGDWVGTTFAVPWLGGVKPLALDSLTQLDPGPPPALGTQDYRDDLAEVRAVGDADAPLHVRSQAQTDTAFYFAALPFSPMQEGLRGVATSRGLDISESARLFAATNTIIADALGTAWNAKLEHVFWRPITAIREAFPNGDPLSDGDPLTEPDPDWNSLLPAPPYPEWPSGLCSVIGAMTASLQHLTGGLNLTMGTNVVGYRTWTDKALLDQTAVDARIWSGIHFRTSDEVAIDIGDASAGLILDRYFAPTD
jgi:hypothetical protein